MKVVYLANGESISTRLVSLVEFILFLPEEYLLKKQKNDTGLDAKKKNDSGY